MGTMAERYKLHDAIHAIVGSIPTGRGGDISFNRLQLAHYALTSIN